MLDSLIDGILRSDWAVVLVVGAILIGFRIGRRHTAERRKAWAKYVLVRFQPPA